MRNSVRSLLVCSALLMTGMRDPFHPPADPCAIEALSQWRYRGMVEGAGKVGIVQDGQKRWHRLKQEDRLAVGWRVMAINETELVVDVGETCEPQQWTWQREGAKKNGRKDNTGAGATQPPAVGRRAEAGHAGGG